MHVCVCVNVTVHNILTFSVKKLFAYNLIDLWLTLLNAHLAKFDGWCVWNEWHKCKCTYEFFIVDNIIVEIRIGVSIGILLAIE